MFGSFGTGNSGRITGRTGASLTLALMSEAQAGVEANKPVRNRKLREILRNVVIDPMSPIPTLLLGPPLAYLGQQKPQAKSRATSCHAARVSTFLWCKASAS